MRRLLIIMAVTTSLLGLGVPGAGAAPPPPPEVGTVTLSLSAPGWWDAGAGYQFWGCHLNVSAPLVNTTKGSFTFVAAEFDGSYWNDFSSIRLRHGSTEASFATRGVFAPTERVYGARVTLFRGKTQVAQNQTVLTTPLVCPAQTP